MCHFLSGLANVVGINSGPEDQGQGTMQGPTGTQNFLCFTTFSYYFAGHHYIF